MFSEKTKRAIKIIAFLGFGVLLMYLLFQSQMDSLRSSYEKAHPGANFSAFGWLRDQFGRCSTIGLFGIAMVFAISNFSRALRWNMLIRPLGYYPRLINSFFAIKIGYMVNCAIPRAGEIARPATLYRYDKIPMNKLMGTMAVDRILDVVCTLALIGLAVLLQGATVLEYLRANMGKGDAQQKSLLANPYILAMLIIGAVFGILTIIFWNKIVNSTIGQKTLALAKGFWDGVAAVGKLERPWLFVFHTIFIWFMFYMMMFVSLKAFPPTVNFTLSQTLVVFVFSTFGILVPSPGGAGSFHFFVMEALVLYGISSEDAFAFANIQFIVVTLSNVFFGLMGYGVLPIYNRLYPAKETPTEDLTKETAGA